MSRVIVDTQGARLSKSGERLVVEIEGQAVQTFPLATLQQVILVGRGVSASTPLLYDLMQRGVDVVYQSQSGAFGFRPVGPLSKHSALRMQQALVTADPARALPLARAVVIGKLRNQAVILRRYDETLGERGQRAIQTLVAQVESARAAAAVDELMGYEGSGAAAYFAAWGSLFDHQTWGFEGRAFHPPPDPVNAMLSLGYTLLLNDIVGAVYRIGLDPALGVLHAIDFGRPSLALDLEEEFRPVIVDTLVLTILRQRLLEPTDFQRSAGRVTMSDDARRFFIARYQDRVTVKVRHPAWQQNLTYAQCIERQVQHMARCLLGRDAAYTPLLIK